MTYPTKLLFTFINDEAEFSHRNKVSLDSENEHSILLKFTLL